MAKLHFYYSAMNAGKSTMLLQSSYNYNERGMDTLLYVPAVDDRYGRGKIATRIGLQSNAIPVPTHFDLFKDAEQQLLVNSNIKCIFIDEAQFLTKAQVSQLAKACDELNTPVLAYGLRTDFRGEPFEGSLYLLAWADILVELKTICHCGRKAIMNLRIDSEGKAITVGEQIEIGGNDRYVAVCRKHYARGQAVRQATVSLL